MNIKPVYQHSKAGLFMFNLCAKWTKFLSKHICLYYLLACTWGIILTSIGLILTFILWVCSGYIPTISFYPYYWVYYISTSPECWGGFEMGLMFVRDLKSLDSINYHEFGHTFQNCLFGPLMIFIVTIPSACRYWIRRLSKNKNLIPYDSIWFEDAATQCGKYVIDYLDKEKLYE